MNNGYEVCCDDEENGGSGCGKNGCNGDEYIDIFDFGGTLDEHIEAQESEEKMAKRLAEAIESAKRAGGTVPGYLEEELDYLVRPKINWTHIIKGQITKSRQGNRKNDWTRYQTRPMFCGLLIPRKKSNFASFACMLDTSGSMGKDELMYGVSQLQVLDEQAEGVITCVDTVPYWDKTTTIRKCNAEELRKTHIIGNGGGYFEDYFEEYEKRLGRQDFLIVITDGYEDFTRCKRPTVPTFWIITSHNKSFNPRLG